jgi:NADH:ubiquinone oxidoreductase subunit 6 (subunit J)
MLLKAEFLAITLVLVYVGAVMVLFLFVVMMLDINLDQIRRASGSTCRWPCWSAWSSCWRWPRC